MEDINEGNWQAEAIGCYMVWAIFCVWWEPSEVLSLWYEKKDDEKRSAHCQVEALCWTQGIFDGISGGDALSIGIRQMQDSSREKDANENIWNI